MSEDPSPGKSAWQQVGRYMGLGMMLPASTVAGLLIGYGLDYLFHTTFLRIVFVVLGTLAGFVQLIRELTRETK